MVAGGEDDSPREDENDTGPDRSGQVRRNALDANLCALELPLHHRQLTFSGPSNLFRCSSTTEPSELVQFSVTSAAITPRMTVSGLITNGGARITKNGGWVFASDGQTVSAATVAFVGTYNDTAAKAPLISVVPAADGTNVWFLGEPNMGGPTLLQFDRTTFQLLRTISLAPGYIEGNLFGLTGLVQWSPTGFASVPTRTSFW